MATIRVPVEAQSFLSYCRKHELTPAESATSPCFETYADLIVFAASYGFAEMNGKPPERKTKFLDRPNPIDLGIFKTDKRFPQILLMALATSGDQNVVRDEDLICRLIEDFASVGCSRLEKLNQNSPGMLHLEFAKILAQTNESQI